MSNTLQQMFELIRDEPDNDEPRLVLADWFEDQAQLDRANFIRYQLERAKRPYWDVQTVHLELKERALLEKMENSWRIELPNHEGIRWGAFERGFVSKIAFDNLDLFDNHIDDCVAATPVHSLILKWPRLDHPPNLDVIPGLRELTMIGPLLTADDMAWLANSPVLSTVHALNFVDSRMDVHGLDLLLNSPHIQQLRALRMPVHNLSNKGIERLVQSDLAELIDLDLSVETEDELGSGGRTEPTMDQEAIKMLTAWKCISQLHSLNLNGNQIGIEGLQILLSSTNLKKIKTLKLRNIADWAWADVDLEKLDLLTVFNQTASELQLIELDIGENNITKQGAQVLAACPALSELKVLRMDYENPGDGELELIQAPWFDSLHILSAEDTWYFPLVLQRKPKQLHTLQLASHYGHSQTGEKMIQWLKNAPVQDALLRLDLSESGLDDQGLEQLGQITCFPNLVELRLVGNFEEHGYEDGENFNKKSVNTFIHSPLGKQLISLNIGHHAVNRLPDTRPSRFGVPYLPAWYGFNLKV